MGDFPFPLPLRYDDAVVRADDLRLMVEFFLAGSELRRARAHIVRTGGGVRLFRVQIDLLLQLRLVDNRHYVALCHLIPGFAAHFRDAAAADGRDIDYAAVVHDDAVARHIFRHDAEERPDENREQGNAHRRQRNPARGAGDGKNRAGWFRAFQLVQRFLLENLARTHILSLPLSCLPHNRTDRR